LNEKPRGNTGDLELTFDETSDGFRDRPIQGVAA
jgi:hypothetical protein